MTRVLFGGTVFVQRDGTKQRDEAIQRTFGIAGSSPITTQGAVIKFYPSGDAREAKAVESFLEQGIPVRQTPEIMNWKTAPQRAKTIFNA